MKYIIRLTVTLLVICALMAAVLAGVNLITKDRIAAAKEEKVKAAISAVLPDVSGLEEVPLTGDTGIVSRVYTAGGAYAVEVNPSGFGGTITMMVGVQDGKVTGISIVSQTETAGLGAVAAANNAKGESFRAQFVGGDSFAVKGNIDAISGATITSQAVTDGVNAAVTFVKEGL